MPDRQNAQDHFRVGGQGNQPRLQAGARRGGQLCPDPTGLRPADPGPGHHRTLKWSPRRSLPARDQTRGRHQVRRRLSRRQDKPPSGRPRRTEPELVCEPARPSPRHRRRSRISRCSARGCPLIVGGRSNPANPLAARQDRLRRLLGSRRGRQPRRDRRSGREREPDER